MKLWKKGLALMLALVLGSQLVLPALAAVVREGNTVALTDKDGNIIDSRTQEDWETAFPYGTFAFERSELQCAEGGETQSIRLLRLGGTAGKAEVTVSVAPVLSQLEDGRYSAAMAASIYDYVLAVEDALPIAAYQPYGRDPQPLAPTPAVAVSRVESACTEDSVDEDGETVYGSTTLRLDARADSFLWQGKNADGAWVDVSDEATLELSNDALAQSDFRCVYTAGGQTWCSDSYHGEAYVCEDETLPEVPGDLERNPEKSYHVLDTESAGVEPFDSYEFIVTFAEGETEKEILLTPVDDDAAENTELLALRISGCKGGVLYDTASTLTVAIDDNEPQEPSFFGFEVTELTADKSAGSARLTVRRSGALQYVAAVDYRTQNGTAVAGQDYAETTGTLYFPADVEELTVEVPLINDGELLAEEDSDLFLFVLLENPAGGGEDSAVVAGKGRAVLNLYNSGEAADPNLATMLYTPEADDVSGSTGTTAGAIAPGALETVEAKAQPRTSAQAELSFGGGQGGIAVQTVDLSAKLSFSRRSLPTSRYWDDYADLGGTSSRYASTNDTQGLAYQGWDNYDQVKKQSDGYMGRYAGEVGGSNGKYLKWNRQIISNFDQQFSTVYATYRGKTENNYLNQFHSTSRAGLTNTSSGDLSVRTDDWVKRGKPGTYTNVGKSFNIKRGDTGLFLAMGIEDKGGWDTRHAGGSVYQIARAQRLALGTDLKYLVHTADDDAITAVERMSLYDTIAPSVSIDSGKGGVDSKGHLYVGSRLTLGSPVWGSIYQYAETSGGASSIYLTRQSGSQVNTIATGTAGKTGQDSYLTLLGQGSYSFAKDGGNLSLNDTYTVNVVLDRRQSLSVNVAPSVERNAEDPGKAVQEAVKTFWDRAEIELSYGEANFTRNNQVNFDTRSLYLQDGVLAAETESGGTLLRSEGTYKNIRFVNFHLPHTDQILFNGVQYAGDDDIPIPVSMFGMETLPFTYYASEYVSVESDMTMVITRIEHYIDANGNGQLDGMVDSVSNQFVLVEGEGADGRAIGKDVLVRTLSAGDYSITEFTPVYGTDGKPVQQFLKFYYSMTPRCLTVPEGAGAADPAQILPAFVTSVTDEGALSRMTREMQGYRFVDSGRALDGGYTGDGKLMYGAKANAIETVDVPLGGDYAERKATYIYQSTADPANSEGVREKKYESYLTPAQLGAEQSTWYLVDAEFQRKDWVVDYQGSLLYRFLNPEPVFLSDPLFGELLPTAGQDGQGNYLAADTNRYLGSFNERDTIALCIRPQSRTTQQIHDFYDGPSTQSEVIESGDYRIEVDSSNATGIRTVPDATALTNVSGADGSPTQNADSSASPNTMKEFNLDVGVELPSLSLALSDYITLITDGDQFGFSIGAPLFSAKKEKQAHVSSDADRYVAPGSKPYNSWSSWETENPRKKNGGNWDQLLGVFGNFQETLKGEAWQSAKAAQERSLKRNAWGAPLTDANGSPSYNDKLIKSSGMEFSLSFNVTVMFKYSPVENAYRFSSAMILLQFGFEFRKEVRLSVCPILYAYIVVGVSLEAGGGLVSEREIVENTGALLDINSAQDAEKAGVTLTERWTYPAQETAGGKRVMAGTPGDSMTFENAGNAFHVYFQGKLQVEREVAAADGSRSFESLGYISSDGSQPVLVMAGSKLDSGYTANTTFRLTVLEDTAMLDRVAPIAKVRSDLYFSGITLSPSAYMEVGAGIGVEMLKAEIYFKASIGITMSFATRKDSTDTQSAQTAVYQGGEVQVRGDNGVSLYANDRTAFSFDAFNFRAGFGVRVVLLFFKFEMDLIQFGIDYDKSQVGRGEDGFHDNGWKFAWYALNGKPIKTYSLEDGEESQEDGFPGVKITIPANDFTAQQIFGPEEGKMVMDEIATMAFDPANLRGNEFQISGYSSSGDAFRLASGLDSGDSYQLVTLGGENYLLYTVQRQQSAGESGIHASQLVLSRIRNTGEDVGLVNPADADDATRYLPVDNDDTGDLDFSAQVSGNTLRVTWVSYASADTSGAAGRSVSKPGAEHIRPSYLLEDGVTSVFMAKDNYTDPRFQPAQPENAVSRPETALPPAVPVKPAGEKPAAAPVMPLRTDYYLTAAEYEALSEEARAAYLPDADGYYAAAYGSYQAAAAAYTQAVADYGSTKALWDAWQRYETYLALKAAWDAYEAYLASPEYLAYETAGKAYDAWYGYFQALENADGSAQALLAGSARNTVVKTAEYTVGGSAFTAPTVLGDRSDAYKFLPALSPDGKLSFYARSNNFTSEEKTAADGKAKDYYDATKGTVTTDADGVSSGDGDPSAAFRYAYATSMNDVYGKNTQFVFHYTKADGSSAATAWTPQGWDQSGTRLSSVDLVMLSATEFYLAYTATQTTTNAGGKNPGETNVHKLYLQKGSVDPATGEVTLEAAKMLRTLVDVNEGGVSVVSEGVSAGVDGVYRNSGNGLTLVEAHEDPYFGKVRFLRGVLGGLTGQEEDFGESLAFQTYGLEEPSLFLLFEMNGAAYVVPQASLESITGTGSGSIIPFFTVSQETRGRGNLDIGTDGEGNISAVYTAAVPNTTNNAVYVAKYDPNTLSFGEGRMLAMNQMQVYEDSIANGWNAEDTEKAYLGQLESYEKNYGLFDGDVNPLTSFTFSDLAVALGLTRGSVTGQDADGRDVTAGQSTLVILARGTQTKLEQQSFLGGGSSQVLAPRCDANGVMETDTGFYALSFGVGEKSVGEGQILFASPSFVPGTQLRPTVSFKNTGDVPLLASETEPVTVALWITGWDEDGHETAGEELMRWTVTEPVAVGQTVTTTLGDGDYAAALPQNLGGRSFYFTVQETGRDGDHPFGVDDPLVYSSRKEKGGCWRTIEEKPELAVEDLSFRTVGVEGDSVRIGVELKVTNRGAAAADAPYLQFSYQTGYNEDAGYRQETYAPLDISQGKFTVSRQSQIKVQSGGTDTDRRQGILRLVGEDGADLKAGYERSVTGSFLVSKDAYCDLSATGSLNLQVAVMQGSASITTFSGGVLTADYSGEYLGENNQRYASLEPTTFFTAPKKLTLPLGSTMRLALPGVTTEESIPLVDVAELNSQAQETAETHMGVLYYNMGASGTASDGFLVLSPASEGSGILRVTDRNTSSFVDIAYTVTETGTGVNIFKDNNRFTWFAPDGGQIDPDTDENQTAWKFQDRVVAWGSGETEMPYLGDLSRGSRGAWFTFDTLAEKIELFFDGTAEVRSDADGFETVTLTAQGGRGQGSSAVIDLGKNPTNAARSVTVKVLGDTAAFDRMVEQFAGNRPILPDTSGNAPQIYFSRTLPETASLIPGQPVSIPVYVVDENGLANEAVLTGNGELKNYEKLSARLHRFDLVLAENGSFTLNAINVLGKSAGVTVTVDWFNRPVSAPDAPLTMDRSWSYRDLQGNPISLADDAQLKTGELAFLRVTTAPDGVETDKTLFYYDVTEITTTTTYQLIREETAGEGEGAATRVSWYLEKTVTRTDGSGQLVQDGRENPLITREDAAESTAVPTGTVVKEVRGQWQEVTAEDGVFPVTRNGIYRLSAASRTDERSVTELFLVNRINGDLPTVFLTLEREEGTFLPSLLFAARKGENAAAGLRRVELVGESERFLLAESQGAQRLSGSLPVNAGGSYTAIVTDEAGNQGVFTLKLDAMALRAAADAVTVGAARNNDKNDGSITVHGDALMGGSYDGIDAKGVHNAYAFALVAAAEDFDERREESFQDFLARLTWHSGEDGWRFDGLTPGVYVLYLKDAGEAPETQEGYLTRRLTVNDDALTFVAMPGQQSITITASGAEEYEYLVFMTQDGKLTPDSGLDAVIAASRQAEAERAAAERADAIAQAEKDCQAAQAVLDGMDPAQEGYADAQAALAEAREQLRRAQASTAEDYMDLGRIADWSAQSAYEDLDFGIYQVTVRDKADHTRSFSRLVAIQEPPQAPGGQLTPEQEQEIIDRNQNGEVAVEGEDCIVILPKGLLRDGDSVNALLLTRPEGGFTAGTVVTVTVDGQTRIIPWCAVQADGRLLYLAMERGEYALFRNIKEFRDTVNYWAEEDICFTSARELFQGTGEGVFSPDRTMTRGMFVTVLGRLAGVDAADHPDSRFTDVPNGFWCGGYVNWAAENGILDGYADGSFRPNAPVQRQQMAKLLCNFAKLQGQTIAADGSLDRYSDWETVSDWAVNPCIWASDSGILQGRQDGRLDPKGQATRAQVAAVLHRYVEYLLSQRLEQAEKLP